MALALTHASPAVSRDHSATTATYSRVNRKASGSFSRYIFVSLAGTVDVTEAGRMARKSDLEIRREILCHLAVPAIVASSSTEPLVPNLAAAVVTDLIDDVFGLPSAAEASAGSSPSTSIFNLGSCSHRTVDLATQTILFSSREKGNSCSSNRLLQSPQLGAKNKRFIM